MTDQEHKEALQRSKAEVAFWESNRAELERVKAQLASLVQAARRLVVNNAGLTENSRYVLIPRDDFEHLDHVKNVCDPHFEP